MQSMPSYYQQQQQAYQTQSPYQNGPPSSVLNSGAMVPHSNGLPPMQHPGLTDQPPATQAPKRKQVKNACTNCQKACKKCDDARPCPRCIKYGIADTCVNSVRKERKKGIKRGPYKRRQKTGEEKARKTTDISADQNGQQQPQQLSTYTPSMRGPAMNFGYPSNLNQYGQHYDPYGQYAAAYHKDSMMPQPYVVNSVYPPMGYPVVLPGTTNDNSGNQQQQNQQQNQNQQQQQQQQQQHTHPYQHSLAQSHYSGIMQQQHSPQQPSSRPPMMHNEHVLHQSSPSGSPQIYYQQAQNSQPPSQRSSPLLSNTVKPESSNESFVKPPPNNNNVHPMTPVPSTSTSTATTSSPDSGIYSKEGYSNRY